MNEEKLVAQVRRFKAFDYYNAETAGELVRVLWNKAESAEHARRIVDRCMELHFGDNGRCCPTPAELAEVCEQVPPEVEQYRADAECPRCHGTGLYSRDEKRETPWGLQLVGVSSQCACRRKSGFVAAEN